MKNYVQHCHGEQLKLLRMAFIILKKSSSSKDGTFVFCSDIKQNVYFYFFE